MNKLILARHSYAESGTSNGSDFKRKLTPIGNEVANSQAKQLLDKGLIPNLIITSNAQRAIETTRVFQKLLNTSCPIFQVSFLYDDYTTAEFFDLVNQISSLHQIVLIMGHNPTISLMSARLDNTTNYPFKPGSLAVFNCGEWSEVEVGNSKVLEYLST
ncbi:MAG: hypothetical protein PF517_22560 [Salinivirgaceae bacterium]|nr:hypothetical protein [Salinivirgaceae bacterium]